MLLFQEHEQHADAGRDVPGGPGEGGRLPGRRLPRASPAERLLSEVRYMQACSVSDPDRIRIRIEEAKNYPQKYIKNLEIEVLNVLF